MGGHEIMGLSVLSCVVLYLEEAEQGISGHSVNKGLKEALIAGDGGRDQNGCK